MGNLYKPANFDVDHKRRKSRGNGSAEPNLTLSLDQQRLIVPALLALTLVAMEVQNAADIGNHIIAALNNFTTDPISRDGLSIKNVRSIFQRFGLG